MNGHSEYLNGLSMEMQEAFLGAVIDQSRRTINSFGSGFMLVHQARNTDAKHLRFSAGTNVKANAVVKT
ncbi:uncharacterized protein N7500_002371 [Penicillium coprophilum]|uniref:uncharacterized protein n=1 Tax=Penicillium coprophilum TaxID=36646 RepID=UPI00238F8402|nr:uncharacterized protein N7500_002371 [Penicillium coprophilum]KAJ5169588.1 hypothetical protein N7500_002371 [Penicillium coprophilum]